MDERWRALAVLVGRVLLSAIFLLSGVHKIADWTGTAETMGHKGMPAVPVFLGAAIAFEVIGGLSLLIGWRARLGALALFLFLIPTTLVFHDFWNYQGPAQQQQSINFLKNLAIMGGLLVLSAFGPGPWSLSPDVRRRA